MKNCKVILSGAESEICVFGQYKETGNGFKLFYELDGDRCTAEYTNGAFTQIRQGELNITLKFIENEESECLIADGELSGTLDVFTKKLVIDIQENGATVFINYELGGEGKTLTLTAKKN